MDPAATPLFSAAKFERRQILPIRLERPERSLSLMICRMQADLVHENVIWSEYLVRLSGAAAVSGLTTESLHPLKIRKAKGGLAALSQTSLLFIALRDVSHLLNIYRKHCCL
jgi:hypothetical protein